MENFADRYRGVAFLALFLGTLLLAVLIVLPFLPALLWAVVLSILMGPMYRGLVSFFRRRRFLAKGAKTWAGLITTVVTFLIICVPFVLIGIGMYAQVSALVNDIGARHAAGGNLLADLLKPVDAQIKPIVEKFGSGTLSLADYARDNGPKIVDTLRQPVSHAAGKIAFTGLSLIIALITMFFMLRDAERLLEPAYELLPLPRERTAEILKRIGETVYAVFIGTVLVAIIQGTLMGLAFMFAGVPNAFLFGIVAVFLCMIPLIGAPLLYIPAALMLLAQGNMVGAIIVACVGFGVNKLDYFVRPKLIAGKANLHPIGVFFGILGGVLLFGPVGLVAGPMVLAVLLALQDVVRERVRGSAGEIVSAELTALRS